MKESLVVEYLTADEKNKIDIQSFVASRKGNALEDYIKNCAWKDDDEGITKVYLVKDKQTQNIVFFFALSAGLLYRRLDDREWNLSDSENEIVNNCVQYLLSQNNQSSVDEALSLYELDDEKKYEKLRNIILKEFDSKMGAEEDRDKTEEGVNINHVAETYPSIVLTHFCKNVSEGSGRTSEFPIGFYIFWEIVVEKVLEISRLVGCKYLYLFAADRSENIGKINSPLDFIYDIDEDEQITTHELVDYYTNDLKFEQIRTLNVIKPQYDFSCFSLFQAIDQLEQNRELAWIEHSDMVE